MKRTFLLKTVILLCALVAGSSSVWAVEPVVTADFTAKTAGNSNYTNTWTYGNWSLTNCANNNKGWAYIRCGGKGGSSATDTNTDATTIKGTTAITKAIGEVKVIHSGTSNNNFTVNSIVLEVSSESDFSVIDVTKTLTPEISKQVAGTVSFTEDAPYAANSYYRVTINWTVKGTSNYGLDVTKIEFYEATTPHALSSAVFPAASGTVALGATSVCEGMTTTITATPNDGYRFVNWSVTGTGSSVTDATSASTTFTMGTEDAMVTANFEEIPSHTLSSAIDPIGAGTVTFGSTSIKEGATTTATAAANSGYKFTGWSISGTGATLSSTSTNPTTITMGTADVTVTATFEAVKTYAITYSVNGNETTVNVEEDANVDLSSPTSGIPAGYVFKGWRTATLEETDIEPDDYVTAATSTADITYYAVMAVVEGGTPATLTKMIKGDTFAANDKVVVVATIDETTNYAMYQETTGGSYVKNYLFTESAESVASNDKNWWTVTASGTKWKLGDATNGYLYSNGSNNLSVETDNASEWTLEDNEDGTFSLTQGRYLSCRSDLTSDNKYLYRLAGSTPAGVYNFTIYKYVEGNATYANYCTSLPSSATITPSKTYTTLTSKYPLDFTSVSSDLKAFVVLDDDASDNTITMTEVSKVPANTGLVLKASSAGSSISVPVLSGVADDVTGNLMAGSAFSTTEIAENGGYILKDGAFHPASAGTLAARKAYLNIAVPANAPVLMFDFGENTTTDISEKVTVNSEKLTAAPVYNLNGQRVAQPTKGLYIVNGKKVVVK